MHACVEQLRIAVRTGRFDRQGSADGYDDAVIQQRVVAVRREIRVHHGHRKGAVDPLPVGYGERCRRHQGCGRRRSQNRMAACQRTTCCISGVARVACRECVHAGQKRRRTRNRSDSVDHARRAQLHSIDREHHRAGGGRASAQRSRHAVRRKEDRRLRACDQRARRHEQLRRIEQHRHPAGLHIRVHSEHVFVHHWIAEDQATIGDDEIL